MACHKPSAITHKPVLMKFFATTARGTEALLATELRSCGAAQVEPRRAGVAFEGTLETAYRACLWSRVASRVLLPVGSFQASSPQMLYERVRRIRWHEHLGPQQTLAVDFGSSESDISHSHFGALKTKDAIVDQIRERLGARPSIDTRRPDVRVNVYLHQNQATVSLDLSGDSLHRRGYRQDRGLAPLKENVAAAVLLLGEWPRLAGLGAPLLDPMCGSGTLPIEAALIAANIAPGRLRSHYGFIGWRQHDAALWKRLLHEAQAAEIRDRKRSPRILGYDDDARAVRSALVNLERAGLRGLVHIEKRSLEQCEVPEGIDGETRGLFVINPPYGERLGNLDELTALYARIGDVLRRRFLGWKGLILTGNARLAKSVGLRPGRRHILYNGAIECRLLEIPISHAPVTQSRQPAWR
jgi:23S rRNA (guanine2445-N2)-methyltransferase / 23S rRNA (guanine2069-N7)-methyltransferase